MTVRRVVALAFLVACSENAPKAENAALGGDVAARVGSEVLTVDLVRQVAIAQKISPREAAARLVDDAVAADAAKRHGLEGKDPARWQLTATRARIAADRFFAEAKSKGPPSDAEVELLTQQHWRQVDRPPAVRVMHVVVCPGACNGKVPRTPEAVAHAREVATSLRPEIVDLPTPDEIQAKAKSFAHPSDVELRPEILPAVAQDGRTVEAGDGLDPAFATAAWAIPKIGDTSPVVETKFGFHIIRLLERIPERRMSFENRRIAFTEETYAMRAAEIERVHVEDLRKSKDIQVSKSAERLMRAVTNPENGAP